MRLHVDVHNSAATSEMEIKIVSGARPLQIQRSHEGTNPAESNDTLTTHKADYGASYNKAHNVPNFSASTSHQSNPYPTRSRAEVNHPSTSTHNQSTYNSSTHNPPANNSSTNNSSHNQSANNQPKTTSIITRNKLHLMSNPDREGYEYYEEEIDSRANVRIERVLTPGEALRGANPQRVGLFALLVLAVTLLCILTEDNVSLPYILMLVALTALAFFRALKL